LKEVAVGCGGRPELGVAVVCVVESVKGVSGMEVSVDEGSPELRLGLELPPP